jgi:hypothetical protein
MRDLQIPTIAYQQPVFGDLPVYAALCGGGNDKLWRLVGKIVPRSSRSEITQFCDVERNLGQSNKLDNISFKRKIYKASMAHTHYQTREQALGFAR